MNEAEVMRTVRAHLELQFPKTCSKCGRVYASLRDYLKHTQHAGRPVSFDAEQGIWRPFNPAGTLAFANCGCGTTLALSSHGMPLLTLWRLMAWARAQVRDRRLSVGQLLEDLRGKIDAQVLGEPETDPWAVPAAERLRQWRTSIVELYLSGIVVVAPLIIAFWMLTRAEPAFEKPAPSLLLLCLAAACARLLAPKASMQHAGVAVVVATGFLALPVVGMLPAPTLVLMSGAVLATTTYGLRWGLLVVALASLELFFVARFGSVHALASSFGRPQPLSVAVRMAAFFALSCSLLLVALSRLFDNLERAWTSQQLASVREREALQELRRAESAAREVERLEALGRLAGGVAHDFNNLLLIMLSWTDLLASPNVDDQTKRDGVAALRQAANQASGLTRRLLTFARKDKWTPTDVSIDDVVAEMAESLRRLLPSKVRLEHVRGASPKVPLDEAALGQVLVNLVVNAGDAMPGGGVVRMSTEVLPAAAQPAHALRPDADHVVLRVSDTGVGMDEEVQARAFEPLFTTKPEGQGTGLGLASVYGIVQQAGGWIDLDSELGRGTTFRIGFPIATRASVQSILCEPFAAQGGKVLIVENDEQLRQVVAMTLRAAGHEVTLAATAADGLLAVRRQGGGFDVLCADAPSGAGDTRALIEGFVERFPSAGVIVLGGGQATPLDAASMEVLQKPVPAGELLERVAFHIARLHEEGRASA